MQDYRVLVGWTGSEYNDLTNYARRTFNTNQDYIKAVFIPSGDEESGRHWSSESVNNDYARAMGIYSSTTGAYSNPAKSRARPYVLVHNEQTCPYPGEFVIRHITSEQRINSYRITNPNTKHKRIANPLEQIPFEMTIPSLGIAGNSTFVL